MKRQQTNDWRYSIRMKLMVGFGSVVAIILICSTYIYQKASDLARQKTYEKMQSQAEYYMQSLDNELGHIRRLQMDFFNDRMLATLIGPIIMGTDYEEREKLLSLQERIKTIVGVSNLIEEGILYLPKSGYKITASRIGRMSDKDTENVREYAQYSDGQLHYSGSEIFLVETGTAKLSSDSILNHVLVITFSKEQMQDDLAKLATSEGNGALLYQSENNTILEHGTDVDQGGEILKQLAIDDNGNYLSTQRITVNGEDYLVFVGGYGVMGLFVEYSPEAMVMKPIYQFRNVVFALFAFMIAGAVFYAFYVRRLIHRPVHKLLKAFQRIEAGDFTQYISHNRKDEFGYLYDGFNEMEQCMVKMIDELYIQTNLTQRAQMKQLQTQIAPHFLYNSFFSLNSKMKRKDYDGAMELARHLGAYFRYLTRNEADYVTLEQEVEHARSYTAIQGTRFVNRISINFEELPEAFREIIVPRLILQPILENAFQHGLGNKVKDGILRVRFEQTDTEWRIFVEDNGEIDSCKIEEIADGLKNGISGEITSIYNIHKRLQIYRNGQSGLRVSRSDMNGLCVMLYIFSGGGSR